ncbi:MAG: response regulator transcription factor [Bilophila wadsworthia]
MDGYAGKGHQVLLIDDDSEFCELMTDYLDVHSFAVSSVHTGTAGIEAARRQEYDVILLDMLLPDISGIEVLRHLRTETRAPVVILSAHNEETDRIVTLELGADDYVPKTFSARELLARIGLSCGAWKTPGFRKARQAGRYALYARAVHEPQTLKVTLNNEPLDLTSMEFQLLYHLARGRAGSSPARICSTCSPKGMEQVRPLRGRAHRPCARSSGTIPGAPPT